MRTISYFITAGLLAFSVSALAGEFKDECAWGLANDKHVKTDCKLNMVGTDGKTYCFSNEKAKEAFMKDPTANIKKAKEVFGRA